VADASAGGTAPDQSDLLVDRSPPGVAVVTLNRPHRLNALTSEMLARFYQCLERLGRDETCRAIVVTGAGPRTA
jgi:enoyl-CoA hydratase